MSLHHVKQIKGRNARVGDLLAREGSWDRKYRILHISDPVAQDSHSTTHTITVEYLGRFYADGTSKPVRRPSKRDLEMIRYTGGFTPGDYVKWHVFVEEI
jgi:hypothetical protein